MRAKHLKARLDRQISDERIEKALNKVLNNLSLFKTFGWKIFLMNSSIRGEYKEFLGLPKGGPTRINIINFAGRDIAREIKINPRLKKKLYNKAKLDIWKKIGEFLKSDKEANAKLNRRLEEAINLRRFRFAELLGRNPVTGVPLGKISIPLRKRRNLKTEKSKKKS